MPERAALSRRGERLPPRGFEDRVRNVMEEKRIIVAHTIARAGRKKNPKCHALARLFVIECRGRGRRRARINRNAGREGIRKGGEDKLIRRGTTGMCAQWRKAGNFGAVSIEPQPRDEAPEVVGVALNVLSRCPPKVLRGPTAAGLGVKGSILDPKARIEARPVTTSGHANKSIAKRENRGAPLHRGHGCVIIELDITFAKPSGGRVPRGELFTITARELINLRFTSFPCQIDTRTIANRDSIERHNGKWPPRRHDERRRWTERRGREMERKKVKKFDGSKRRARDRERADGKRWKAHGGVGRAIETS